MSKPSLPAVRRFAADDRDLERRVRTLETRANATSTGDAAWIYPTLNSYGNGSFGSDANNPVRYRKDANGFVHVQGGFTATVTSTNIGASPFTLPAGYRPGGTTLGTGTAAKRAQFWGYYSGSVGALRITVDSAGVVDYALALFYNTEYGELGHICFYAEN